MLPRLLGQLSSPASPLTPFPHTLSIPPLVSATPSFLTYYLLCPRLSYAFWSLVEGIVAHQLSFERRPLYTCSKDDIQRMLDEKVEAGTANYYWLDIFNKNQ